MSEGVDFPNMFRIPVKCEKSNSDDMDFILDELERLAMPVNPDFLMSEGF